MFSSRLSRARDRPIDRLPRFEAYSVIDIHDPVCELCERLGLDPRLVGRLVLTPRSATVVVYLTRADGAKYVDPDTNSPATRIESFEVQT